ncbi:MAG: hypothetical protein JWR55_240 [Aeromicrobium sp.]|nr:hypothetical protein [Aeromicrobium sp.]
MGETLAVLAADLTWIHVRQRTYGNLLNWDHDVPPTAGQHVMAADGSGRMELVVVDVRGDGVIVLDVPVPEEAL